MPKKELDFIDWAAKRRTQEADGSGIDRLCQVDHRVKVLPCGCRREDGKELLVSQRGTTFLCATKQVHADKQKIFSLEVQKLTVKKHSNTKTESRIWLR